MSRSPIISVENVYFRYDQRNQEFDLNNLSFELISGQWLTIIGNNGSGKSTLARLIVGLEKPESGSITIDQEEITEDNQSRLRKKVGIVFQNPDNQFIGTTVQDDVAFALENLNMPYDEMKRRVFDALKQVDMYELREMDPSQLSGGQKQRVAIAGMLALKPDLIIFDESFIMLDPRSRRDILGLIKSIQMRLGLTIITITHDSNEVIYADEILVLADGQVLDQGDARSVFQRNQQIDPPFAEAFRREIKKRGLTVPNRYMSEEELVAMLCK